MMKQRLSLWNDRLRVALSQFIAAIALVLARLAQWLSAQATRLRVALGLPKRAPGQGLVEYALILVLVAVVVIAILTTLGPQIGNVFSRVACTLDDGTASQPGNSGNSGNANSPMTCQ